MYCLVILYFLSDSVAGIYIWRERDFDNFCSIKERCDISTCIDDKAINLISWQGIWKFGNPMGMKWRLLTWHPVAMLSCHSCIPPVGTELPSSSGPAFLLICLSSLTSLLLATLFNLFRFLSHFFWCVLTFCLTDIINHIVKLIVHGPVGKLV